MALAAALLTRYAFHGVVRDLTRAIALGADVVADVEPCPAGWLSLLGHAHERRHRLTADAYDLDRAVDLGERAVSATADDDVALATRQARLAAAHWGRHHAHGDVVDLDRAVSLLTAALARRPEGHPDVPPWQAELAVAHLDRYRVSGDANDVETAVELGERALAGSPAEAPGRVRIVADLCAAHVERTLLGRGEADVPHLVEEVVDAPGASPLDRVAAHHSAGVLARTAGHVHLAVELLDTAVALLPSVAPREAGWADQQHRIGTRGGLVGDAVAAHCAIGDPMGAFQVAELGRGVLLAGQASTRVDLATLRERAPHLADRFHWVCERLNTPGFPTDERKRWWAQYDALLGDIGAVPGLEDFGVPVKPDDLRRVPAGGTVVLVNTSRHRSDAVLLRSDADPVVVALPDLRPEDAERWVADMFAAVEDYEPDEDDAVQGTLRWLWDSIVGPVVDALRPSEPHRVWWLPTGVLGLLPLHAAGPADGEGALDLLVSSYTTSLRALRAPTGTVLTDQGRLVISVSEREDMPPLPAAKREAERLGGHHLAGAAATADEVLAALPDATSAHFACHAVVDLVDQAGSGLVLHDRTLRLPEIGALRLHDAELAYLSACSTGNHGTRYADEVLHVGAAFQLAGFRHVIATLWPLNDNIGSRAARNFYRYLTTADDAASVLREVVLDLRELLPNNPSQWASLIHSGP
ncbi:CHAT domain-containing protein [Saccharothrix sp. MB29]|nr:CHAT domain-containing protein [Saccharothrix sp. MB29]